MKVALWVTSGTTESGDDLPVIVWKKKPSTDRVEGEYRFLVPHEFEIVGYVNWKLTEVYENQVFD